MSCRVPGFGNQDAARTHGRGCAHRRAGDKASSSGVDFEPGGLADRADPKAKNIAAISFKPCRRMVPGGNQFSSQFQNRRICLGHDAECGAGVLTNQFGVDDLAGGGV